MQKILLFLGGKNSIRSQIAEGIARNLTQDPIIVLSAGGDPAKKIHPHVSQVMSEIGFDISDQKPKKFTPEMLVDVSCTIFIGDDVKSSYEIPMSWDSFEKWDIESLDGKDYESFTKVRNDLYKRIKALFNSLNIHIDEIH